MKRAKRECDDKVIRDGNLLRSRAVIYITVAGDIQCANKRLEWLAKQCARGGWIYNSKFNVMQLKTSHRLPNRTYIQLF